MGEQKPPCSKPGRISRTLHGKNG
jgi:hypothetical protein